ncbi:hypothetical protein KGF54_001341 [Candida jiufengensis]|uniref:uncharacterized protein n=1 Tax=Candida jiufengensis TaxID=497108 RepID=UPI0022241D85|nr:uncharacterized protein KGF54_001341 [Candida jiufengensis]KAI5955839.1 hypothetical protein KGF54_001341 [Candida jiufengensis]
MSLKIILPTHKNELNNDLDTLENLQTRKIAYYDETIKGYIINNNENNLGPKKVSLYSSILPQGSTLSNTSIDDSTSSSMFKFTLDENQVILDNDKTTVWQFELPIMYQRKKYAQPNLFISCKLEDSIDNQQHDHNTLEDSIELPNFMPVFNDFMAYSDISINEKHQNIEETIVSKNLHVEKEETTENIAEISIPIISSLVIKLKTTKPAGRNGLLLAALNIECSEEMLHLMTKDKNDQGSEDEKTNSVNDISFDISELNVIFENSICEPSHYIFPTHMGILDSLNVIYKLISNDPTSKNTSKPISIKLTFKIQKKVDDELIDISNVIQTEWSPFIDFGLIAPPINNALKTNNNVSQVQSQVGNLPNGTNIRQKALLNNIYKLKSPSTSNQSTNSLSVSSSASSSTTAKRIHSGTTRVASSVTVNLSTNVNSSLAGLRLTFIGKLDMKLGQVTNWKIQAVNNSINRLNLSLLVQNPINFNPIYNTSTTSGNNNFSSSNLLPMLNHGDKNNRDNDIIIQGKTQLFSLYNSLKTNYEEEGVIILNNDVRIGPLDPQTVFETNLQLIGNKTGIFNLDGIKIFDINTGDGLDFGKLIEVFVV